MGRVAKDIGLGKPGITTETKTGINLTWISWTDGKKLTKDTLSNFFNISVAAAYG